MERYDIYWSDGNGAASRGISNDKHIKTHITAADENEMWKILFLLRVTRTLKSASAKNIASLRSILTDYGNEGEDLEWFFNRPNYKQAFDEVNLDGIDGGEPWVISVKRGNEELYDDGFSKEYEEVEDDEW